MVLKPTLSLFHPINFLSIPPRHISMSPLNISSLNLFGPYHYHFRLICPLALLLYVYRSIRPNTTKKNTIKVYFRLSKDEKMKSLALFIFIFFFRLVESRAFQFDCPRQLRFCWENTVGPCCDGVGWIRLSGGTAQNLSDYLAVGKKKRNVLWWRLWRVWKVNTSSLLHLAEWKRKK